MGQERWGWSGKEGVEVQPVDLGTNNADETNTSEEEDDSVGWYGTKRIHIRQTTNQWFPYKVPTDTETIFSVFLKS